MEPRLCACGCTTPLEQNPGEKLAKFKIRKYVTAKHYYASVRIRKTKRCAHCRKRFERRRMNNGKFESTFRFSQRVCCSKECYSLAKCGTARNAPIIRAKPVQSKPVRVKSSSKPKKALDVMTKPPEPLQAIVAAPVNRPLPDPTRGKWETIAPARLVDCCPKHPTERAGSCTACAIKSRPQFRKPCSTTPIHKRMP